MTTVVEALMQAAQDVRDVFASLLGLRTEIISIRDNALSSTQTIIYNFQNRDPAITYWCDPVDGLDTNDGLTIDKPKKNLERIVANVGITATVIRLLNDARWEGRYNLNAQLTIYGVQRSGTAPFFVPFNRRITLLGAATNSPSPGIGSFCSGLWGYSTNFSTYYIDFALPDVAPGITFPAHFHSSAGTSFTFDSGNLTVGSQNAGSLCGASQNRSNVYVSMALGAGAAGHLIQGVAAGANPNAGWNYSSNITSA